MKPLLFDHNLSPKLVERLNDLFEGSTHVSSVGLSRAADREVWDYAREHDFLITTKDADFIDLEVILGFPPKVIWIRRDNCSTNNIEVLLRESADVIDSFIQDTNAGVLSLS